LQIAPMAGWVASGDVSAIIGEDTRHHRSAQTSVPTMGLQDAFHRPVANAMPFFETLLDGVPEVIPDENA